MAEFVSPYAARLAQLAQEQKTLERAPMGPMFTPEEQTKRQKENSRQMQLGILAQLTGDKGITAAGEPVLKQAMEQQKRRITEHGEFDPTTGKLSVFPEYTRRRSEERLQKESERLTAAEAAALAKWNSERARAEDRADLRRLISSTQGAQGSFQFAGTDAAGNPILMHNKTGKFAKQGPNGLEEYKGPVTQRGEFARETKELEGFQGRGETLRGLRTLLTTPAGKEAFGTGTGGALTSSLPQQVRGMVTEAVFTPEQIQTRAKVYEEAYQVAHALAGAAMSFGEQIRLEPFIPQPGDPVEVVQEKLNAAQQKYDYYARRIQAKRAATSAGINTNPGAPTPSPTDRPAQTPTSPGGGATIQYDVTGKRVQ